MIISGIGTLIAIARRMEARDPKTAWTTRLHRAHGRPWPHTR
ncbi:hypothetical protein ACIBO2_24550 [Nonomuraea sp. NPDC050022]